MSRSDQPRALRCGLCGHTAGRTLFAVSGRQVIRCAACGIAFTYPPPEAELYQDASYFTQQNEYFSERERFRDLFQSLLEHIERHRRPGRMLDVGCGPGFLLALARERGWEVAGVELSAWASRYAHDKLGLPVICGSLATGLFAPRSVDVVVMNHVLEHLPDPRAALALIRDLLKEDGLLVVGVPNFGSLAASIRRERWYSLLPDQHLWHFTPASLGRLLRELGFQAVETTFENHTYAGPGLKLLAARLVARLALIMRRGEAMVMIARKRFP